MTSANFPPASQFRQAAIDHLDASRNVVNDALATRHAAVAQAFALLALLEAQQSPAQAATYVVNTAGTAETASDQSTPRFTLSKPVATLNDDALAGVYIDSDGDFLVKRRDDTVYGVTGYGDGEPHELAPGDYDDFGPFRRLIAEGL